MNERDAQGADIASFRYGLGCTADRDRLLTTTMSRKILATILANREGTPLLSGDHSSVAGTSVSLGPRQ